MWIQTLHLCHRFLRRLDMLILTGPRNSSWMVTRPWFKIINLNNNCQRCSLRKTVPEEFLFKELIMSVQFTIKKNNKTGCLRSKNLYNTMATWRASWVKEAKTTYSNWSNLKTVLIGIRRLTSIWTKGIRKSTNRFLFGTRCWSTMCSYSGKNKMSASRRKNSNRSKWDCT